jgi:DNA-binding CsgD family transcriptional regulator
MRFREATEADIAAIAALTDGRNALPLEPRVRQALPHVLGRLLSSPACTLTLFEEDGPSGAQAVSFVGGLFVREPVIERYLEAPFPGLVTAVLRDLLDGGQPLLTLEEIRRANGAGGLTLAVLPIPYGRWKWDDPTIVELRKLAPQAFLRQVGGYRLRAIYYEVFTDEIADYLRAGGYRLLHDFSARAGSEHFGTDCRPRMLRLTPSDLPPGAMSMATQMFEPPAPRLGLTPAEQRVVLRALDGASDQAVAESLGLSPETIRSNWKSIYQRLATFVPGLVGATSAGDGATRGTERRRAAIEYLRQNMHELRPWSR